jgi:hypothetical protein
MKFIMVELSSSTDLHESQNLNFSDEIETASCQRGRGGEIPLQIGGEDGIGYDEE